MEKLSGKVAVITGGSSGIGLASAKLFMSEGAYVFITGRRQKELDDAVEAIGQNVTAIQGDVSSMADLDGLCASVGAKGRLDIVFANAGVGEFATLEKTSEAHFDKLFDVNVKGTLFTIQKALPLLNDGSSIILTGSVASAKGTGAWTWTVELKDRHVRSNVLSPGPTETPFVGDVPPERAAQPRASIPMGRTGTAEEIAKAALFLASDDSSFVTGIELFVDGGRAQI